MAELLVDIEVVYAAVDRQLLLPVTVLATCTLREAVLLCGIGEEFPQLELATCSLGVFGKVVADPQVRLVQAGDRIEIYRPLLVDPKEVRRLRAAKAASAKEQNQ